MHPDLIIENAALLKIVEESLMKSQFLKKIFGVADLE